VGTRDEWLEHRFRRWDAGDRERALWCAVVGDVAADHLVLHRFSGDLEVLLGDLPGTLDSFAAAGGEEDSVEVTRRQVGKSLGQLDRLRVGIGPEREERELAGLLGRRLGKLRASVPDLDDEQPREPVEIALALVVPDVRAVAAHNHGHVAALIRRHPGEMHPQVLARAVRQVVVAGFVDVLRGGGHDAS
jgi:hypothetical protein